MTTRAVERPPDEQAPPRLPTLRSQFDGLLDLADEFTGRASGPHGPKPLPGPSRDLLPAVLPQPSRTAVRRDVLWLGWVGLVLVVLVAVALIVGDTVEHRFRADGPYLEDEVGMLGPPVTDAGASGSDAVVAGSEPLAPGSDAADTEGGPLPADSSVPGAGGPVDGETPPGCGAAELLDAAQALTPEFPVALTDTRCDGAYAVVGMMGAPTAPPERQLPWGWIAFRRDGGTWQRLGGGFILEENFPEGCRALTASDPAFPAALCG